MPSSEKNNSLTSVKQDSAPKPVRKAPGTRVGTIQDWRAADGSGKSSGRHGQVIRDGR